MKKAVIFDFDGTITQKHANVWLECWKTTNFPIENTEIYGRLYNGFISKKIDYKTWNFLTCEIFKSRNFNINDLKNIIKKIKLKPSLKELLQELKRNNFDIFIVSGGIKQCIEESLGEMRKHFTYISANDFIFDCSGKLKYVKSTEFDFEGKAKFIELLINKKGYNKENLCFIGNSFNDEEVYKTGIKTICITPSHARHFNKKIWNETIYDLKNLTELLPHILENDKPSKKIEI